MAENSAPTNWLDVLAKLFWPLLALLALIMFFRPLSVALDKVAANLGSAENIELGPIRLKFVPEAARDLPRPSPDVATTLAQLGAHELELLVSHAENQRNELCRKEALKSPAPSLEQVSAAYERLFQLKLVKFEQDDNSQPTAMDWCARRDAVQWVVLTDFGKQVRQYLLQIITKAVVISKT